MNSRPKPSETEEDILKQQKQFLINKCKPSVKVVSVEKEDNYEDGTEEDKNIEEPTSNNLVRSIIEKKTVVPVENIFPTFSAGFPQAKRRQLGESSKKGSIFSQQSKKLKENSDIKSINLPVRSFILTGKESEQIHQQNVITLDEMSEKEILEEQKKLLSSLDPEIVKFLKSKRSNTSIEADEIMEVDTPVLEPITDVEDIETPKEILDSSEKWLHFQTIETEKLQWMKNIEIPKNIDNEQYEARFDFGGWLLPYTDSEVTESNRTLFHHGEEPGRPGYSIKELFKLCRSNVQQQRILSLNTISNIVSLQSTGVYDSVIEIPMEQIFFVVRVCLDDNSPAILNACIKTMFNLFHSQIDETCLDSLIGFGLGLTQPRLAVNSTEVGSKEDEREVNDQQLAELDLVRCLVRTDILVRIRYIINTVQPTAETVNYCLNLLIRLMRDSSAIMLQVFKSDGLFSSIIKHFVPKIYKLDITNNCYGTPMKSAIKLLRITAARSKNLAQELINKYNILDSIFSYIGNDNISVNIIGVKIQIESFNLLAVLFNYNLCLSTFMELQPFLIRALDYHIKNTDISDRNSSYLKQIHCAGVLNIITIIATQDFNLINHFIPLLMQAATKYCAQISSLTDFKCGNLQLISSLFMTICNLIKSSAVTSDFYIEKLVVGLLKSLGFRKITEDVKFGSNLLCNYEPHKTASNFTSIEAAVWPTSEHVVPCLLTKSCIPFLSAFSYYIETCDNTEIILKFLNHPNIIKYLTELNKSSKYNFTSNWFTKLESQLLLNILKSAVKVQNLLPDSMLYYELSVKCMNVFNEEQKTDIDFILKNVVFNAQFYPQEVLLDNLSLNDKEGVIHNSLKYLDEIYECYSQTMNLKKHSFKFSTITIDLIGNIVPIDWSYFPIVALYANHTEDTTKEEEVRQIFTVTRCLQWIFLYENYFPDLAAFINPTDRFCRLACTFLISNTLFLEKDVRDLLRYCLQALVKQEVFGKLNFDQEIQGLNNFQDFYVQLLEQYQGVSYGDIIFANFVLIPLIQRQNMKWRKILWSEYLGVAQTITLNQEQCLIDVQEFLNPPETDLSLLKCYRRALVSNHLQRSPLLQQIANYHVENYVRNRNRS